MVNIFEQVNKDDIVIDCGAYVGRIANYFADKEARVYTIEPSQDLCLILNSRFREYDNVSVICGGAYDSNCDMNLYYHKDFTKVNTNRKVKYLESTSIYPQKKNVGDKFFTARMFDISEFVQSIGKDIKLLKLNVEGAEYKIINRLIDTGDIKRIEHIVVAFHNRCIPSLKKEHVELKKRVIKLDLYENIVQWKWWHKNTKFLNKIRKDYSL